MKRADANPNTVSLNWEHNMLINLFKSLDYNDLNKIPLVCRAWREAFLSPDFSQYHFSKVEVIEGKTSKECYEIFTRLTTGDCSLNQHHLHKDEINSVLAQNDQIFSCSEDKSMRCFDLKKGSLQICPIDDSLAVDEITIFRNNYLAGLAYQTLWIWDFEANTTESFSFNNPSTNPEMTYNLSKIVTYKEDLILSGLEVIDDESAGSQLFHFDYITKTILKFYNWKKGNITHLQIDKDSLAAGCEDGTIILIDLASKTAITKKIHLVAISSIVFCDHYLISCDEGGFVKVTDQDGLTIIKDHPLPRAMINERIYQLTAWNKMIISISKKIDLHQCKLWNLSGYSLPIQPFSFSLKGWPAPKDFKRVVVHQDSLILPKEEGVQVLIPRSGEK